MKTVLVFIGLKLKEIGIVIGIYLGLVLLSNPIYTFFYPNFEYPLGKWEYWFFIPLFSFALCFFAIGIGMVLHVFVKSNWEKAKKLTGRNP